MTNSTPIELLAPARTAEVAIEAIKHGADAVYIGGPTHGARASATNSLDELRRVAQFAHLFDARVYVALNTLIYPHELDSVRDLICRFYEIGIDALIVQDMAVLRMDIPPIALHASTQCDIRTPLKAKFLEDAGFSQLVLPREFTLPEIAAVRSATSVPLEAFVHGALCVSYSGDCQASFATTGRSGNRGECAQICRWPFDLIDGNGRTVIKDKHLLSLRDMNRSASLEDMINAGITSFKIEGRLKDITYVKETVAYYDSLINKIILDNPHKGLTRQSRGKSMVSFRPNATNAFNRGFSQYFLSQHKKEKASLATFDTPKFPGTRIGVVDRASTGKRIRITSGDQINNGDGLTYFDKQGQLQGFRVNRVEGNDLHTLNLVSIPKGTILYRNFDSKRQKAMLAETANRKVPVTLTLRATARGVALDASSGSLRVSIAEDSNHELSTTPQSDRHKVELSKTGTTPYEIISFKDEIPDVFIPASTLSRLRRRLTSALDSTSRITHNSTYRRQAVEPPVPYPEASVTRHMNVANPLAAEFYHDHGVTAIEPALEVANAPIRYSDKRLMTTRYCLRAELGYCLRTAQGKKLKAPLSLRSGNNVFALEFDCDNCQMFLLKNP